MTSQILKSNGQVIYTLTYRALTDDEMANPKEIKLCEDFDAAVTNQLGAPISDSDLQAEGIDAETPTFEVYEDNETPPQCLPKVNEVTPEDADNYVSAEVNLPIRGTLLGGTVKQCACDIDGNLTGKANMNPIWIQGPMK